MSVIQGSDVGGPALPDEPPPGPPPVPPRPPARRRTIVVLATIAAVALIAVALVVANRGGEDEQSAATTTIAPTTTVAPTTTTTVAPPTTVPVDTSTAVYPSSSSATRFDDPVAAARSFAVDFVGFVDPIVGELQQGDSQSGEVEVRPSSSGPVTTVLVRRLGESWWVLGAATGNIELREPAALATISSPVRLQGVSTAFEANVSVEVRQDGDRSPLGEGYVMGGSMGELGPFDGTVTFAAPSAPMGAIVLYTASMENGNIWEASVVRVGLAPTANPAS